MFLVPLDSADIATPDGTELLRIPGTKQTDMRRSCTVQLPVFGAHTFPSVITSFMD
jgi:hypothetical protein